MEDRLNQTIERKLEIIPNTQDFYTNISEYLFEVIIQRTQGPEITLQLFRNAQLAIASMHLETKDQARILNLFESKSVKNEKDVEYINDLLHEYIGIFTFSQLEKFTQKQIKEQNQLKFLDYETEIINRVTQNLTSFEKSINFFNSIFELLQQGILQPFEKTSKSLQISANETLISSQIRGLVYSLEPREVNPFIKSYFEKTYPHFLIASDNELTNLFTSSIPSQRILGIHKINPLMESLLTSTKKLKSYQSLFKSEFSAAYIISSQSTFYIKENSYLNNDTFAKYLLFYNPNRQISETIYSSDFKAAIHKTLNFAELSIQFEDELKILEARRVHNLREEKYLGSLSTNEVAQNSAHLSNVVIDHETHEVRNNQQINGNLSNFINFCTVFAKLSLERHQLEIDENIKNLILVELIKTLIGISLSFIKYNRLDIQGFPIKKDDILLENNDERLKLYVIPNESSQKLSFTSLTVKIKKDLHESNPISIESNSIPVQIAFENTSVRANAINSVIEEKGFLEAYNYLHDPINFEILQNENLLFCHVFESLNSFTDFNLIEDSVKLLRKFSHISFNHYIVNNSAQAINTVNHLIQIFDNTDFESNSKSHRLIYLLIKKLYDFRKITESQKNNFNNQIRKIELEKFGQKSTAFKLAEDVLTIQELNLEKEVKNYQIKIDAFFLQKLAKVQELSEEEITVFLEIYNKYDLFLNLKKELKTKLNNYNLIRSLLNSQNIEAVNLAHQIIQSFLDRLNSDNQELPHFIKRVFAIIKNGDTDLLANDFEIKVAHILTKQSNDVIYELNNIYTKGVRKKIADDLSNVRIREKDYAEFLLQNADQ